MSDKLHISNEMKMFDRKVRDFYDSLDDDEKKKFSPYLMIRWGSSVEGSRDLQEFYVIATNERLNKKFFSINTAKHKKLQWLLATTVSPDVGVQRHTWISNKKKDTGSTAVRKQLAELFPQYDDPELDVLAAITTKQELAQYLKDLGQESKK